MVHILVSQLTEICEDGRTFGRVGRCAGTHLLPREARVSHDVRGCLLLVAQRLPRLGLGVQRAVALRACRHARLLHDRDLGGGGESESEGAETERKIRTYI